MATVQATVTYSLAIDWDADGVFSGTDDVTAFFQECSITTGINDPDRLLANVGSCTLTLDNTDRSFSPLYTSSPYYGKILPRRPVRVQVTDGVTTWTLWRGFTSRFIPQSGEFGERRVTVECFDYMAQIQNEGVSMPLQTNILSSTLIRHVINTALKAIVASATIAFSAIPSAGDTVVVNGTTITWRSSIGATADEVLIGATVNDSVTNLANCINKSTGSGTTYSANQNLPRIVSATPQYDTRYDASNADTNVYLAGNTGAGSTTSSTGVQDALVLIGNDVSGSGFTDIWASESFTITGGRLTQFTIEHDANVGSPSGTITWDIRSDNAGNPGTILQTGTYTPVPSTNNTVPVGLNGIALQSGTTYWIVWRATTPQASDTRWVNKARSGNPFAGGVGKFSSTGGASWTANASTVDSFFSVTTQAVTNKDKLAQSFQLANAQSVSTLQLYLRKIGSPAGTLTLRIESDSGGSPSGSLANVNATTTLAESSLTSSFANTTFTFASPPGLSAATTYWLVLSTSRSASASDFVAWGADASAPGYTSGEMKSYATATWSAETKDAIFSIGSAQIVIYAQLRGAVGNSYTLAKTGSWCTLSGSTLAGGVDYPTELPPSLETGENTFQYAADNWTSSGTNGMSALEACVMSEYGSMLWVARDGTITFKNRLFLFTAANAAADLTLSSEHNALDGDLGDEDVFNRIELAYTPLGTLASGVIAESKSTIAVPGLSGLTERYNPTAPLRDQTNTKLVKLPFVDPATGQAITASSVITPLVPTTDWTANEAQDGSSGDYTGSPYLRFSIAIVGPNAEVTITNIATGQLYITMLKIRGVGLHRYNQSTAMVEDRTSQTAYGSHTQNVTLPIVSTAESFPQSLATYLLGRTKDPAFRVDKIAFTNQNLVNGVNLFSLNVGNVLSITDYQTGMSVQKYVILGMEYSGIGPQAIGSMTFYLYRLDDVNYWILGSTTLGVLGVTTRPAI